MATCNTCAHDTADKLTIEQVKALLSASDWAEIDQATVDMLVYGSSVIVATPDGIKRLPREQWPAEWTEGSVKPSSFVHRSSKAKATEHE